MNSTPQTFIIGTPFWRWGNDWTDAAVPAHFKALADELVRRGHRAVLLVDNKRQDLVDTQSNPAIYTWPSDRPTQLRDFLFALGLIRRLRPTGIIANFGAVNALVTAGFLTRVPIRIPWYHTLSTQLGPEWQGPARRLRWQRWRKRVVYRMASHIATPASCGVEDLSTVYDVPKAKCRVWPNSVPDPFALYPQLQDTPREPWRLVCAGRMSATKGQETVVQAVALLKDKLSSLHVEFIGSGPTRDHLIQLAGELGISRMFTFSPFTSHEGVLQTFASAQATIVPSLAEMFGLVGIESLAVGTPVIGSDTGGIPDYVKDGTTGYRFQPGRHEELAGRINDLFRQATTTEGMRGKCREFFLSRFEQTATARGLAAELLALCERKRHGAGCR